MRKLLLLFILQGIFVGCQKQIEIPPKEENQPNIPAKTAVVSTDNKTDETNFKTIELPKGHLNAGQITNYVAELKGFIYRSGATNVDVFDLSEKLSIRIVESVNDRKLYDLDKILKLDAKSNEQYLKVYSLGHDSGGTRGFINYPIVTWENKNKKQFAFNLSKYINCKFQDIYKLNNELYLLIGYESGSGMGYQSIAYVIQIKNEKLNPGYPAFVGRPYLNFLSGKYTFDLNTNILEFKLDKDHSVENLDNIFYYTDKYADNKFDSVTAKRLKPMIAEDYYEKHFFRLKFNGKTFLKAN